MKKMKICQFLTKTETDSLLFDPLCILA